MKKSLAISCAVMLAAAATMTAIYVKETNDKQQQKELQLAQADTEKQELSIQQTAEADVDEEVAAADSVVKPEVTLETTSEQESEEEEQAEKADEEQPEEAVETAAEAGGNIVLHFGDGSTINWPLQGTVLMNYSMDQTVYFQTLDQYKYNPAVLIGCDVNSRVNSAADGVVTDISTNEVTGLTVTMDIGDGYNLIYGQLKQIPYEVGTMVTQGSLVGFVAEPTKYYSEEGCNLYFAMEKDGVPIDPASYFE